MRKTARPAERDAPERRGIPFSRSTLLGMFFVQRYRFLSVPQYARAAEVKVAAAYDQLLTLERHGYLGHFGNIGLQGRGRTPKVYYLKRKGYEALRRESDIPEELIGSHKETFVEARWSPQMYHRLRVVDLLIALEIAVRKRPNLTILRTFLEYQRVKRGTRIARETTDFVAAQMSPENRIVPDAAFVLENVETCRRALFFIEMDMATERIVTTITRDRHITLHHKITQYDRYLMGGRFVATYAPFGEFKFFTLLFVTYGDGRVDNIRREMHDLPQNLAPYYRFTTFEEAMEDFLGPIWKTRSLSDDKRYPLVR